MMEHEHEDMNEMREQSNPQDIVFMDTALILKVAAAVYEYILSHANILPALGVERREYAESGLDFLPNEF